MENSKELIKKYFFNEHLKVKEIAEIIHTSSSYITKIIKQDNRYIEEKKYRINKSKENYYSTYESYYGIKKEQFLKQNNFDSEEDFLEYLKLEYKRNKLKNILNILFLNMIF